MKHLTKLIILIIFISCNANSAKQEIPVLPENSKKVKITLKDSLGNVSFSVPSHFDTSFIWTNRSDCGKPCDKEQYRFQSKKFPIFKESGFVYKVPDIPIDQITIIHSSYFPFHDKIDSLKNYAKHEHLKENIISETYNATIIFDTIEKITDRYFSIVGIKGFDSAYQKRFIKVQANTTIKGNQIEFHFEIKQNDSIDNKKYIENSINYIKTIAISNGI